MSGAKKGALAFLPAVASLIAYWVLSVKAGGFHAVRRYGRVPGGPDWAFAVAPGEWLMFATGLLVAAGAFFAIRKWPFQNREWNPPHPRRIAWAFAALAFLLSLLIRLFLLDGIPLFDDEMTYRFQADILAGGRWSADPPPDETAFEHLFLGIYRGRWFGQYGFGHPLVLAGASLIATMGLAGPLCCALLVLAVFWLSRRLFGVQTALLAAALAATSPMFTSTGATLLSQNSATPLVIAGVAMTLGAMGSGRLLHVFAAALIFGAGFWIRSLEPLLLGAPPMLLLLLRRRTIKARASAAAVIALAALLSLGPLLLLQWKLWGRPFWSNYQAYWWGYLESPLHSPFGFGASPWDIEHHPAAALSTAWINLVRLDAFLLGVPLACVIAVYGLWKSRGDREKIFVFLGVPLTFIVLFFYFWPGLSDTGPQNHHACGALLLPFVAFGIRVLAGKRAHPLALAGIIISLNLLSFTPAHLGALSRAAQAGDEIPRALRLADVGQAVVFTELRPWAGGHERSWVLGRPLPRSDLSDPVIYLRTQGKPVDTQVAKRLFPERKAYFLKQIEGKLALLPLEDFRGRDSLIEAARKRDLPD